MSAMIVLLLGSLFVGAGTNWKVGLGCFVISTVLAFNIAAHGKEH